MINSFFRKIGIVTSLIITYACLEWWCFNTIRWTPFLNGSASIIIAFASFSIGRNQHQYLMFAGRIVLIGGIIAYITLMLMSVSEHPFLTFIFGYGIALVVGTLLTQNIVAGLIIGLFGSAVSLTLVLSISKTALSEYGVIIINIILVSWVVGEICTFLSSRKKNA